MSDKYILAGKTPVPCDGLHEWARWFGDNDRSVARDEIGPLRISTIFLGMDHRFGDGDPLLFETMIFGEHSDDDFNESYCERCSTWEQAETQHAAAVEVAKGRLATAAMLLDETP